jgi:hypothetical protein
MPSLMRYTRADSKKVHHVLALDLDSSRELNQNREKAPNWATPSSINYIAYRQLGRALIAVSIEIKKKTPVGNANVHCECGLKRV